MNEDDEYVSMIDFAVGALAFGLIDKQVEKDTGFSLIKLFKKLKDR